MKYEGNTFSLKQITGVFVSPSGRLDMMACTCTLSLFLALILLFYKLQSQFGGFLSDSLYLLISGAVIGVPTVGVHSCKFHTLRLSDGFSQCERSWLWVQDASCGREWAHDQNSCCQRGSSVARELMIRCIAVSQHAYLSHCRSRASATRATADRLSAASFWAAPGRQDGPIKAGRVRVSLTALHNALPNGTQRCHELLW